MRRPIRVVTPYSGARETGVNVPSLRLFLSCHEGEGQWLSCPKTGAVWNIKDNAATTAGELEWDADGGVRSTNNATIQPSRINHVNMPTIASDKVYLLMASAHVLGNDLCRCSFGDINKSVTGTAGMGFGMSDGAYPGGEGSFHCAVGYYTQQYNVNASGQDLWENSGGAYVCTLAKYTPNSGGTDLVYRAQEIVLSNNVRLNATTINNSNNATPFQLDPYFRFSGYTLYGVALFEFSAFPGWIDTAIAWMAHQWRYAGQGKPRYIYPQLIGYV